MLNGTKVGTIEAYHRKMYKNIVFKLKLCLTVQLQFWNIKFPVSILIVVDSLIYMLAFVPLYFGFQKKLINAINALM